MAEKLRIYVAATADLEAHRSIISHLLARLPVQVGAEIRRCPPAGASYDDLFELISNVDRFYFLMGRDITAPAGTEWDLAVQLQRTMLPFRCRDIITPSAFLFITRAILEIPMKNWRFFETPLGLARLVAAELTDTLLHSENRYGLTAGEILLLEQRRQEIKVGRWPRPEDLPENVLQEGGVILDARPDIEDMSHHLPLLEK